jgi:hypothetical protein
MGVLYANVGGAWVAINGSTQPFGQQSGTFNQTDQGSAVANTWYDWGPVQTIPGVGSTPTSTSISVVGSGYATDFTASVAVLHQIRVGISWDNGSTWSYGLSTQASTYGATTMNRGAFTAQHTGSSPVTGAILVKLQYQANTTTGVGRNGQIYWNLQAGVQGPQGPQGIQGPSGGPMPTGGAVGQQIIKTGTADFAAGWAGAIDTPVPSSIGTADFNTITTNGAYIARGNNTNGPTPGDGQLGLLTVFGDNTAAQLVQRWTGITGNQLPVIWYRTRYTTVNWTAWASDANFFGKTAAVSVWNGPVGSAAMDTAASIVSGWTNGRWANLYCQAIWASAVSTSGATVFTVSTPLRPASPAVYCAALLYPTYGACRASLAAAGQVAFICTTQTVSQLWCNFTYPVDPSYGS